MREPVSLIIVEAQHSLSPLVVVAVVMLLVQEGAHHEEELRHLRLVCHNRRDAAVVAVAKHPPHPRSSPWILPVPPP